VEQSRRRHDQGSAGRQHLKMPQLAMPLRLLMTGQLQTPAIDAVLVMFGATPCWRVWRSGCNNALKSRENRARKPYMKSCS
jgi:hypothetical protein